VILTKTNDRKHAEYKREEFNHDKEEKNLKSKRNKVRRKR
jgi:hypothetical protein